MNIWTDVSFSKGQNEHMQSHFSGYKQFVRHKQKTFVSLTNNLRNLSLKLLWKLHDKIMLSCIYTAKKKKIKLCEILKSNTNQDLIILVKHYFEKVQ